MSTPWWRGVLYQIYPRSFADTNGDGIGDLQGVIAKLDYLEWLGVDGIWLNPIHPSPNVDWGYDVSDYLGVHPDLGALEDVDRLVAEAGRRGICIVLDLVPNHTSNRHPWFHERPDFYVWSDRILRFWLDRGVAGFRIDVAHALISDPEHEIPNNWRSIFGDGPAWTLDPDRTRYYLHNFAPELRDDPVIPGLGLRRFYSMHRPETHEILQGWHSLADTYDPPRMLLGEAYSLDVDDWVRYFGHGNDELDLAFAFTLAHADLDAAQMREIVASIEAKLPPGAWPCWTGSNHDLGRLATRWCDGDESLARCALLLLMTLRGTPCLYYGDELALTSGAVSPERMVDCATPSRDPGRTPMPWTRDGGWTRPWLPLVDTSRNVEDARADRASTLHFTRDLIALRRRFPDLQTGGYAELPAPDRAWAWRRGENVLGAVNLGAEPVEIEDVAGTVALTTTRKGENQELTGTLSLSGGEGAILVKL